ncbi:hypothetical protein GCM10018793_40130 [Streptomyces sulfonofaciens]|uniref:Uncharacterized protein n=1 Tax=Streptomyces sulfonofaciens TaxID=68272 RepID=A0A919GBW7_9ACTN|nr:hypothetical protein GCM10018793_40130 [Streptomyces sulfonofaciens]
MNRAQAPTTADPARAAAPGGTAGARNRPPRAHGPRTALPRAAGAGGATAVDLGTDWLKTPVSDAWTGYIFRGPLWAPIAPVAQDVVYNRPLTRSTR